MLQNQQTPLCFTPPTHKTVHENQLLSVYSLWCGTQREDGHLKVAETTSNINHHCCVSGDTAHILAEAAGNVKVQKAPKLRPKLFKFNSDVDWKKKHQDSLKTT